MTPIEISFISEKFELLSALLIDGNLGLQLQSRGAMWEQLESIPRHCVMSCGQQCIQNLLNYGFIFSCIFSSLTILIALYNVAMHYLNFNNPYFQSKIIAILLMPPIYCVTSTLSFQSLTASSYLTLGRDFYEVFGLFAFYYLIFSFLAYDHSKDTLDERKVYEIMKNESSQVPHDFPCSYFQKPYQLSNWLKAKFFSHRCKRGVLQYIIIKILTTIFLVVVYPNYELRTRDSNDWDYVLYSYVNYGIYWVTAISSYIAYYYMSMFYNCLQKPLQPFKPDLKFTTFNTTIFFTYWQKVWMVVFENNIIECFDQTAPSFHRRQIMYAIQHTLICFQMFAMIFACAQAYSYVNYVIQSVRNVGSFRYILKDIFTMFIAELRLIRPKKFGFSSSNDKTETELQTITASVAHRAQHMGCFKNIRAPFHERIVQNYF